MVRKSKEELFREPLSLYDGKYSRNGSVLQYAERRYLKSPSFDFLIFHVNYTTLAIRTVMRRRRKAPNRMNGNSFPGGTPSGTIGQESCR